MGRRRWCGACLSNTSLFGKKYKKVQKSAQKHQMVEKGEIMTHTYKTIGEIPPFSTISHYPYIWSSAVTGITKGRIKITISQIAHKTAAGLLVYQRTSSRLCWSTRACDRTNTPFLRLPPQGPRPGYRASCLVTSTLKVLRRTWTFGIRRRKRQPQLCPPCCSNECQPFATMPRCRQILWLEGTHSPRRCRRKYPVSHQLPLTSASLAGAWARA